MAKTKSKPQRAIVLSDRNGHDAQRNGRAGLKGITVTMTGDRTFHLHGDPLVEALTHANRRDLIDRFFVLPTLQQLHLNTRQGKARLHFEEKITKSEVLDALAFAMRSRIVERLPLAHDHLLLDEIHDDAIEIWRIGPELSFWRIEQRTPRQYRLWHPLLRSDIVRDQVLQEFATLPDVVRKGPSFIHRGVIHIWVRPHRIDRVHLIDALDPVLANYMAGPREISRQPLKDALVNTNLVLAPISDFLFPPLGIANAFLVGTINRNHIVPAFNNLRQGRTDLHLLYLSIGALTLLTFNFFAAAVMYWFLLFWPRHAKKLRQQYEADFLSRYRRRPSRVWVEKKGSVIETSVREITSESVVVLSPGDLVPGDGVVLSGRATLDDRLLTGAPEAQVKTEGEPVYASSQVLEGELRIQVRSTNEQTAAARIAAWYAENLKINPEHQSLRAKEFAEAAVLPVLIIGALGLYRGGMSMAKAALRPDYLSGPMIAEDFVDLAMTIQAARAGILLANASSLAALGRCDCLILDDTVPWNRRGLESVSLSNQVHEFGIPEVVYLSSDHACKEYKPDFDIIRHGFTTEQKRGYIAQRQHFDHKVAYIGDCQAEAPVAQQANVAISVLTPPHVTPHGTQAALLGADLVKILSLLEIVAESRAEFQNAFSISLVPNAISALSALYLHTHVETSVILSNLGTLANYARYRSKLHLSMG